MSNNTNITIAPTVNNETIAPTSVPSFAPTKDNVTMSPTMSPSEIENTDAPTIAPTTNTTEPRIDVIRLPDYKSHDTVDGFFIGIILFIILVMIALCLQRVNLKRNRIVNRRN